jgi:fatty acid desaturase
VTTAAPDFHPRDVPRELLAVSPWRGPLHIAATWLAIAAVVWACGRVGGWAVHLLGIALIGGLQNHLMVLLHHGIHVNLHPSRSVNDAMARWLLTAPMAQPWSYMRRAHIQHHARLGEADDPDRWYYDVDLFGRRRPKVLVTWLVSNLLGGLLIPTLRKLATGSRSAEDPSEGLGGSTRLDDVSVVVMQLALFVPFLAVHGAWWAYLALWALPAVTLGGGFNCFRTALEHVDAGDPPSRDHSFRSNPIERFFVAPFRMNYHYEHHLLMTVPYYHTPRFRQYLRERGAFPESVIAPSYLARLRDVLGDLRAAR